jgi:1-phosphofructokinase family hexose kinase
MVFESFRYGEVNRASEVRWLAQGKVTNTGIGVHCLGGPSLTLATMGGSPVAEMNRELDQLGVPHRWVLTESATRICTTILDRSSGVMTELVENGRPLNAAELDEFLRVYSEEVDRADVAIITGSLPAETPSSYYRELVKRTPCPVVLDFRGEGLLKTLELKPLLVKPNREELTQTVGCALKSDEELLAAMRSLNQRGAQWVVVTQGDGPVWATSATKTYRFRPLSVEHVANPIGSGDAMTAGIAWALNHGRSVVDAIKLGIAAATENLRRIETCRLDPGWVLPHADQVEVEEIG